jgi:hypothetical protein
LDALADASNFIAFAYHNLNDGRISLKEAAGDTLNDHGAPSPVNNIAGGGSS